MFLKFDEEDSFVPAIIFSWLFFWLGGIICSILFVSLSPGIKAGPFYIVELVGYGFGDALGFTFIAALLYRIRLNKFAITFLPEGFIFGAYFMACYYVQHYDLFKVNGLINRYGLEGFADILFFLIIPVCFLICQGLYIKRKKRRNKIIYSKNRSSEI